VSAKIRIGAVSYLNTRPLVLGMQQGLGAERVELSYDVPSALADRMARGELEIALLPAVELARMPELELVPGLSIATRGPSRSVLLVSRRPLDKIESVALDPESRTSNALVQVLFGEVWKRAPEFRTGHADLERSLTDADAAVRIGDKALFEPLPADALVFDLGAVWTENTGLPFVFAAWAARPGVVDREIYSILHRSRREGSARIEAIVASYAWKGERYPEIARSYLTEHILFRFGAPELDGLRAFLELAARHGVIERAPEIRLALRRRTRCDEVAATHGALTLRGRGA
jgi:chorismate dehydratase